jgi:hypothetical protein
MMNDDDLDRALFELPLADPPAGLRASILAMTAYSPQPIVRTWETIAIGVALAALTWLSLSIVTSDGPIARFAGALGQTLAGVLTDRQTLVWLGTGGIAVMVILLADARPAVRRRS